MPYFSVIIPVYNKENFIESTLKSVLNQSFSDFELILVNDGSTDQSESKIKKFSDERIKYFSKENGGASSARNFGITKATANFITFIDADDFWYPNFLEEMASAIGRFPNHRIFSAAIEVETQKVVFPAQYSIEKSGDLEIVNYFDASMKTTVICTSCAAFHRSVFEKVGNFDTAIKSGQDTDMWIRMGLEYPVVFSWKILARYVYDPKSLSKKREYLNQKMNFSKFETAEKTNPKLKKFIDLNVFSFAIRAKLIDDQKNFAVFYEKIDRKNLTLKKRILLELPKIVLQFLIQFDLLLVSLKLRNSAF
ncbi:MAG: glycosyltransferase family 2 protein [Flavobacterium sp.]|nr:glycosyltransferase family 2 protein [Flavobacterium sp.]